MFFPVFLFLLRSSSIKYPVCYILVFSFLDPCVNRDRIIHFKRWTDSPSRRWSSQPVPSPLAGGISPSWSSPENSAGSPRCRSSTTRQSSICFGSGQITSALWISQTPQDCVGERGSTGVWEVTGPESKPAHECLRWPRPAHLLLRWSCPANLHWSRPARLRLCWFPSAAASPCFPSAAASPRFPSTAESHCLLRDCAPKGLLRDCALLCLLRDRSHLCLLRDGALLCLLRDCALLCLLLDSALLWPLLASSLMLLRWSHPALRRSLWSHPAPRSQSAPETLRC